MFNLYRNKTRIDHKFFLLTSQNLDNKNSTRKKNVLKRIVPINNTNNAFKKKDLLLKSIMIKSRPSLNLLIMNL